MCTTVQAFEGAHSLLRSSGNQGEAALALRARQLVVMATRKERLHVVCQRSAWCDVVQCAPLGLGLTGLVIPFRL